MVANLTLVARASAGRFDLSASVYNLFDERYADPGSPEHRQDLIPQDGRNFRLKLSWQVLRSGDAQRFLALLLAGSTALLLAATPSLGSPPRDPLPEYPVKAAFLYHFVEFVEWPDGLAPSAGHGHHRRPGARPFR